MDSISTSSGSIWSPTASIDSAPKRLPKAVRKRCEISPDTLQRGGSVKPNFITAQLQADSDTTISKQRDSAEAPTSASAESRPSKKMKCTAHDSADYQAWVTKVFEPELPLKHAHFYRVNGKDVQGRALIRARKKWQLSADTSPAGFARAMLRDTVGQGQVYDASDYRAWVAKFVAEGPPSRHQFQTVNGKVVSYDTLRENYRIWNESKDKSPAAFVRRKLSARQRYTDDDRKAWVEKIFPDGLPAAAAHVNGKDVPRNTLRDYYRKWKRQNSEVPAPADVQAGPYVDPAAVDPDAAVDKFDGFDLYRWLDSQRTISHI